MKTNKILARHGARSTAKGFGLVELMVGLLLGLIVVGGAIGVFASNRQAFRTTEGLSRVQENARIGFEMMSRDVRDAGGNPCSKNIPIVNVLTSFTPGGWNDWSVGLRGYDGGQPLPGVPFDPSDYRERAPNTDAIDLRSAGAAGATVVSHNPASAVIDVTSNAGFSNNDIVLMCSYSQGAVFQITSLPSGDKIQHNDGGASLNCSKNLGLPLDCSPANTAKGPEFPPNSLVVPLNSVRWFIGNNRRGGRSLFRQYQAQAPEEIVDGVTDMAIEYLRPGATGYVSASAIANWEDVNAVRIRYTVVSPESVGTDGAPLSRTIEYYTALRNRNQ